MRYCMGLSVAAACLVAASMASAQQLNVICSVQAEWCSAVANEFQRETGIKVGMTLKGSGESMAQIAAEKANPKLDVWFGGTGDPHLQAAEQDLTLSYKSALLDQLHPWAKKQAEQSGYRTAGLYLGVLGIGYNTELIAKKKLPRITPDMALADAYFRLGVWLRRNGRPIEAEPFLTEASRLHRVRAPVCLKLIGTVQIRSHSQLVHGAIIADQPKGPDRLQPDVTRFGQQHRAQTDRQVGHARRALADMSKFVRKPSPGMDFQQHLWQIYPWQ